MIPEKEELLKLIEAIEDMPRMCAADWREKYPEAHQITQQTHPLEPLVVEHYSNRFQMRLQLDLQMKIAKVLVRIKGVSEPYEPRV